MLSRVFATACVALFGSLLCAQNQDSASQHEKDQAEVVRNHALLSSTQIDGSGLKQEMSLGQFLSAIEKLLPSEKNISVRLDKVGLGKGYRKVADAPIQVSFGKVHFFTALGRALAQVPVDVDYAIRPTGVVVTRAHLAAYPMTYRTDDVVKRLPSLAPDLSRQENLRYPKDLFWDVDASDGEALLTRMLTHGIQLKPSESLEFLNGTKLFAVANSRHHADIAAVLDSIRHHADLAVVMNARLYEVDLAWYKQHVVGLLAKDLGGKPLSVVPLEQKTLDALDKQKVIAQSDFAKLRPNSNAIFLSKQTAFRYAVEPQSDPQLKAMRMGLSGVSFRVRSRVSADRRFLRLEFTQQVNQLVKIDKVKKLDLNSGKQIECESPNLRRAAISGTVELPDGGAVLMPVDFRPTAKDKAWVLVARPIIWIGEEMREVQHKGKFSAEDVWKSKVPTEEVESPVVPKRRLPLDDKTADILQSIIEDILTNPDMRYNHHFYGTPEDKTFSLIDSEELGWPEKFVPKTHGHRLVSGAARPFENRRLGISLRHFDLKAKPATNFSGPIEVCVFNAGGTENGAVIGGCSVYYRPKVVGKRWAAEWLGSFDP